MSLITILLRVKRSAALALAWIGFVLLVHYPALRNPGFDAESILGLSVGERDGLAVLGRFFDFLPYYRPVGNLSLWAQYQVQGLSAIPLYFLVNIVLFGLCVHLFVVLLRRAGAGPGAALLAGGFLAVHPNTHTFVTIVGERMNLLYLIFGFLALLGAGRLWRNTGPQRGVLLGTCALLLLSAWSKEIGLAFSFVLFAGSLWLWRRERRPELLEAAAAACAVVAIVLVLHLSIIGLDASLRWNELGPRNSAISLLNTALANIVAAFFPFAIDTVGTLRLPPWEARTVALALVFSAAAAAGIAKAPREVRIVALALIVGHGIASAIYFRYRNHLASDAGAIALACFGAAALCAKLRAPQRALVVAALAAFIGYRAVLSHLGTLEWVEQVSGLDPELARAYVPGGASVRVIEVQRERFLQRSGR